MPRPIPERSTPLGTAMASEASPPRGASSAATSTSKADESVANRAGNPLPRAQQSGDPGHRGTRASSDPSGTMQEEFFGRIGPTQHFHHLFNETPGIFFFAKDAERRLMAASDGIVRRLGRDSEAELIGTTDDQHFPKHVADAFEADDRLVLETGTTLRNRVEIWFTSQRLLDWFVTTKMPIRDAEHRVIGLMGIVSSFEGTRKWSLPYSQIGAVLDHIRDHHRGRITVTELAETAGLSTRQLHRKFLEIFGMNVQEFLTRTRIQGACDELIQTDRSIVEIAKELGFCDQSAFTQQFKKHVSTTPLKFRKEHQLRMRVE